MPPIWDFMALMPTHETVYGRKPHFNELRDNIVRFAWGSWMSGLIRLSLRIDGKQRTPDEENREQLDLLPHLFGGVQQSEIIRFLVNRRPSHIRIVHSVQIHALIQLVLCLAPDEGPDIAPATDLDELG